MDYTNRHESTPTLWTQEVIALVMASLQWQAKDFELRLKSPYQFPLFYCAEDTMVESSQVLLPILPATNPT